MENLRHPRLQKKTQPKHERRVPGALRAPPTARDVNAPPGKSVLLNPPQLLKLTLDVNGGLEGEGEMLLRLLDSERGTKECI